MWVGVLMWGGLEEGGGVQGHGPDAGGGGAGDCTGGGTRQGGQGGGGGGVLTPAAAMGEVLLDRLVASGCNHSVHFL